MTTTATARRPRWARWLLAVALLAPVVELLGILAVADRIGALVVVWLLLDVVLGAMILRRGGASTLRRVQEVALTGRPPTRELADAALTVFGGVLLIVPGFVSDLVAVVCLVPPMRTGARVLLGWLLARAVARTTQRVRGAHGRVVRSTVVDEPVVDQSRADDPGERRVIEGRIVPPDDGRPRPGG
jgi:UPF0716 protein FxsA